MVLLINLTKATCPTCSTGNNCNNSTCTCFSDNKNGYWKNSTIDPFKCDICQQHWEISSKCKQCTLNFDIKINCQKCLNNWDLTKNCAKCINHFDETTSCLKCKSNYELSSGCTKCKKNYDPSKNCGTCLPNFDPKTDCTDCIAGRHGPNCDGTCTASETCHGNGECSKDGKCICFSDTTRGHWSDAKNCSTCLTGYDINDDCISGICSSNCSFSLSKFSRGKCVAPDKCECSKYFTGEKCELNLCYGVNAKDPNICSGRGKCVGFNNCLCDGGYRGRDCSDADHTETLWVGLIVLLSIVIITVLGFFVLMAFVFSKKPEIITRDGSWAQLNEEDIVDSNALEVED